MVRQKRKLKKRDPWDRSLLRDRLSDRSAVGMVVYFHQTHVCEDGVCEYQPSDIRGTLVHRELYQGKTTSPGWIVQFTAGKEFVRSQDLFWHRREGVKLVK